MSFYENNKQGIIVGIVLIAVYFFFMAGPSYDEQSYVESSPSFARSSGIVADFSADGDGSQIRQSAYATVESNEYDTDKASLITIPENLGGYFTNQNENKYEYQERDFRTFRFTFKVPVDTFNQAIDSVTAIGDVQSINVNGDDLSTQYEDNDRTLNNHKKERDKLEALMDRTDEVSDIIEIQSRLSYVQQQIDYFEQRITNLDRQTKLSQITVTLSEERPDSVEIFTTAKQHWLNFLGSIDGIISFITSYILYILGILLI